MKNDINTCHKKYRNSPIICKEDGPLTGIVGEWHIHFNTILQPYLLKSQKGKRRQMSKQNKFDLRVYILFLLQYACRGRVHPFPPWYLRSRYSMKLKFTLEISLVKWWCRWPFQMTVLRFSDHKQFFSDISKKWKMTSLINFFCNENFL